jgi:hypothetical protein
VLFCREAVCSFYHQASAETAAAATILRADARPPSAAAGANPVETAAKIAFVNIKLAAKSPSQGSAWATGKFQQENFR